MAEIKEKLICYHCGDECPDDGISIADKFFCCQGCKLVFEILKENNLCTFYSLNNNPGIKQLKTNTSKHFSYLDDPGILENLISFKNKNNIYITLLIPKMHCSSCIYLLENMQRIENGIISSRVDFLKKEVTIVYDETKTSLSKIAGRLTDIGYEPSIQLDSLDTKKVKSNKNSRIYRIGVAGFCLGNIMMLSFPEYFAGGIVIEPELKIFFNYVILFLALPVFFFSSSEFLVNAYRGIRQKSMGIDIPIALGIVAMFLRSSYEIISQTGPGYFDSMSGLVFFMLVGRNFQDYTFKSLSFERDYKSYFPVAVSTIKNGVENSIPVYKLSVNDKFIVRCNEIIPVDSILLKGIARIDYSFVTGESSPVDINPGERIFAGGKQTGSVIELQVLKEVSQSHLTQLWNRDVSNPDTNGYNNYVKLFSKWFILVTLAIAISAGLFWIGADMHLALNAFTAVLIIACPCAFTLAAPFTFGNILRLLGKNKIYLKNNNTIEKLADIDTVVFDKTGTLTVNKDSGLIYSGIPLSPDEKQIVFTLASQSTHPLSRIISNSFPGFKLSAVNDYNEITGEGLTGIVNGKSIKIGKASFVSNAIEIDSDNAQSSQVFVSIDGLVKGSFSIGNEYRPGIRQTIDKLKKGSYKLCVLSGDNNTEENNLRNIFGKDAELLFNRSPEDKLVFVKSLQQKGRKVLMLGDGLNDAGALRQSNAGISISDDVNNFAPASDGIVDSSVFSQIPSLLKYSKSAVNIITTSFIISLIYNFIGLYFAVEGTLSPVIAAILMPISTVSLVLFTVVSSTVKGHLLQRKKI
jgi:Cu+-exporting ATPase